ncbi:MAG: hypothetical protein ACPGSB_08570, partial [Opitutales bacterium]
MPVNIPMNRLLCSAIASLTLLSTAQAERIEHLACYAEWSEDQLTIGNALVERQWKIEPQGLLRPVSLYDKIAETEWLRAPSRQPAPYPAEAFEDEERELSFRVVQGKLSPVEADSLIIYATAVGQTQSFHYRFQVFPGSSGITVKYGSNNPVESTSTEHETGRADKPTGLEGSLQAEQPGKFKPVLEDLQLSPSHLRYTQVELKDQTDHYDELVHKRVWLTRLDKFEARCNIFHIEDN